MLDDRTGMVERELDPDDGRPWSVWQRVEPSSLDPRWDGQLNYGTTPSTTLPDAPGAFELGVSKASAQAFLPVLRGKALQSLRQEMAGCLMGEEDIAKAEQRHWVLHRIYGGYSLYLRTLVGRMFGVWKGEECTCMHQSGHIIYTALYNCSTCLVLLGVIDVLLPMSAH